MSARSLDRRVLILLAICAALVVTYSIIRGATGTSDFKNPYRVARVFWQTGALDIRGEPRYPPTVRVLLAPLAALPLGVAAAIWTLASMTGQRGEGRRALTGEISWGDPPTRHPRRG